MNSVNSVNSVMENGSATGTVRTASSCASIAANGYSFHDTVKITTR